LPVNFLQPRKPKPPPNKRRYYAYAAAAILVLIVPMVVGFYLQKAKRNAEIVRLTAEKVRLQRDVNNYGDTQKRLEAIEGWANTEMVLLDELYDLFTHFPDHPGVRITKASWSPAPQPAAPPPSNNRAGAATARPVATAKPPERPVGKLIIEATGDATGLDKLRQGLEKGRQWKLDQWEKDTPGSGQARFTMKVFRQKTEEYDSVLKPTEHVNNTAPAGDNRRGRSFPGGRP
jgi:hypothetical protein